MLGALPVATREGAEEHGEALPNGRGSVCKLRLIHLQLADEML
jgi:hypothetical protein